MGVQRYRSHVWDVSVAQCSRGELMYSHFWTHEIVLTCAYERRPNTSRWPRCAGKPCGFLMGKLTTPQRVEWIRGLLIVYDMHAPIQHDLIWKQQAAIL